MTSDRASGPDGFIGAFYQCAWPIIKHYIMAVMLKLYVGDGRGFGKLNRAHNMLNAKKPDAVDVGDFCPISLTHSVAKLFAKMLAIRGRNRMKEVVAANQSAFIKKRNLHDNFLLVRQVARRIHNRREAGLFLKLDISRAFDSLSWAFLFEVMRAKGFGPKWLNWISILLSSATMKVIVNGVPGKSFVHVCGMRQGDLILPLLFIIAMDVLTSILIKAAEENVVSSFQGIKTMQRLSIYMDDVALFIRPSETDLSFVRCALQACGEASGLRVNYGKSSAILIRGSDKDQNHVAAMLQCGIGEFPCKYLRLQLAVHQLTRND